jgi:integrase
MREPLASSPSRGTNFTQGNEGLGLVDTNLTQDPPISEAEAEQDMKWPKRLPNARKPLATIYRKSKAYPLYRLYWRVNGKRQTKSFPTYSEAKDAGDTLVKDLAKGSQVTALTPKQAVDALAALDRLQRFYQSGGPKLTLLEAVSICCDAAGKLGKHTVNEAVDGFLTNVATIARKDLKQAVTDFTDSRKHLGESKDGKRSKHSPVYEYNVAMWLNEFADTFPGHAVCDLTKEHLNTYIGKFKDLSSKSRNDRRAVVKMFLRWAVAKDYLSQHHRLFEAVEFKTEETEAKEIDFYRPKELRLMLDSADEDLTPVIALGGLAGLRREEIMRLHWADVWKVKGKVEISLRIAKGRKRRLVEICPALSQWLNPYRRANGQVWGKSPDALEEALAALRAAVKVPARRNGLRHSFITFHMAKHCNENLTAAEAGNSPQMIHQHYRALATKAEAEKWFNVRPAKARNVITLGIAQEN